MPVYLGGPTPSWSEQFAGMSYLPGVGAIKPIMRLGGPTISLVTGRPMKSFKDIWEKLLLSGDPNVNQPIRQGQIPSVLDYASRMQKSAPGPPKSPMEWVLQRSHPQVPPPEQIMDDMLMQASKSSVLGDTLGPGVEATEAALAKVPPAQQFSDLLTQLLRAFSFSSRQ